MAASPTVIGRETENVPARLPVKRVTMADVAERAAVQKSCVSVVLNGAKSNAHVSAETRKRILQAAQELGYKRNGGMASIATGRFGCVALLLSTNGVLSTLPGRTLDGISDSLSEQSIHLSLFRLPDEELTNEQKMPKILREWMADGMLIDYTHNIPEALTELIAHNSLPAIWINSKQEFDCVRPDDFGVGVAATEYLLERGHRRIAYVNILRLLPGKQEHYSVQDRHEGYLQTMRKAGLTPRSIFETGPSYPPLYALLENPMDRPSAIIAYGGEAESALGAALRLGLRVPQDLSILSLSHNGGQWGDTPITSYLPPEYEIGKLACDLLQEKIADPQRRFQTRVLPFTLIQGDSVANLPV